MVELPVLLPKHLRYALVPFHRLSFAVTKTDLLV